MKSLFRKIKETKEKWDESDWEMRQDIDLSHEYKPIEYAGWKLAVSKEPSKALFSYGDKAQWFSGRIWVKQKGVPVGIPMPIKVRDWDTVCDIMDNIVLPIENERGKDATVAILSTLKGMGISVEDILKGGIDETGRFDTLGPCIWDYAIQKSE